MECIEKLGKFALMPADKALKSSSDIITTELPSQVLKLLTLIVSDGDDLPEDCKQMLRLFIVDPELAASLCDQFMGKVVNSTADTRLYRQALVGLHMSLSHSHIENVLPSIDDRTGSPPRPEDVQSTLETELEISNFMLEAATEATFRASAAEATSAVRTATTQSWMGFIHLLLGGVQTSLDDLARLEGENSRRLEMLEGPGGQFLLEFPNEVEVESGVPMVWNATEQDWVYAKLWNPVRKMPGSQWGKWLRNRFQDFFQTPKPDAPYSIIVPQYGCKMREEFNEAVHALSSSFRVVCASFNTPTNKSLMKLQAGRIKGPTKTSDEHDVRSLPRHSTKEMPRQIPNAG
jgi:hypothetical protein